MSTLISDKNKVRLAKLIALTFPKFAENKLKNPIFIIGSARSGTTLLQSLLATNPDIAVYPSEGNNHWHPQVYPWQDTNIELPPLWFDADKYTQISLKNRTHKDDQFIKSVFGAYQFVAQGKCFLNKSAMIVFMLPKILEIFPEARFIHIIRNGWAVAFSYGVKEYEKIKAAEKIYQERGYNISLEDLIIKCSYSWQEHIQKIEKQKKELELEKKGLIFELKYEELCDNPENSLKKITDFIGISFDKFPITDYSMIENKNYKFAKKLDKKVVEEMTKNMSDTLKAQGYL